MSQLDPAPRQPLSTGQKATGTTAALLAAVALATPFVAKWEGKRNEPYKDIAGIVTVCYGETANVQARRYSDAECTAMLGSSLQKHALAANRCIPAGASDKTRAAFFSFAYNLGTAPLCDTSINPKTGQPRYRLAVDLKAGRLWQACADLSGYNKARINGVLRPSKGLTNRRAEERALCEAGLLR